MSLDKAIEHGKEERKPYRGAKAIDYTCRNHGSCDWCERQTNPVFISEYSMPEDRFKCIMEIETRSTLSATNKNKKSVERLFVPKSQEDVSIRQLSLF